MHLVITSIVIPCALKLSKLFFFVVLANMDEKLAEN